MRTLQLVTLSVTFCLLLSSCTILLARQEAHIHNQLDLLEVEVRRGERIIQLVEQGDIVADDTVKEFIKQRNTIISNNTGGIRKLVGGKPSVE